MKALLLAACAAISLTATAHAQKPPPSCQELITSALQKTNDDPRVKQSGVSARALVAEDFDVYKKHGVSAFDWTPCRGDPVASAALPLTEQERMAIAQANQSLHQKPTPAPTTHADGGITVPGFLVDPPGGVPLPHYDIEATCQKRFSAFMNSCRNNEQEAYDTVKLLWSELHVGRAACVRFNSTMGMYQSLEQCAFHARSNQDAIDRATSSQPFHY